MSKARKKLSGGWAYALSVFTTIILVASLIGMIVLGYHFPEFFNASLKNIVVFLWKMMLVITVTWALFIFFMLVHGSFQSVGVIETDNDAKREH